MEWKTEKKTVDGDPEPYTEQVEKVNKEIAEMHERLREIRDTALRSQEQKSSWSNTLYWMAIGMIAGNLAGMLVRAMLESVGIENVSKFYKLIEVAIRHGF